MRRLAINADLGEGYGAFEMGDDLGLLDHVDSANIACGSHAGDPSRMRRAVEAAAARGVSIGAHPGFDDLWGFGRRAIRMDPRDLENLIAFQIGALCGVAAFSAAAVTHVKLHGALYSMAAAEPAYAAAAVRAVAAVDSALIHVVPPGSELERGSIEAGLAVAREAFADRLYAPDGSLSPRGTPGAVLSDPAQAAAQALALALDGRARASDGSEISVSADTLCVHGDAPGAVAVAQTVRRALVEAELSLAPLPDLDLKDGA
ncbi:MAG: 5-oxoprolinase subunit PxpA [Pseudomonadota bacterium]